MTDPGRPLQRVLRSRLPRSLRLDRPGGRSSKEQLGSPVLRRRTTSVTESREVVAVTGSEDVVLFSDRQLNAPLEDESELLPFVRSQLLGKTRWDLRHEHLQRARGERAAQEAVCDRAVRELHVLWAIVASQEGNPHFLGPRKVRDLGTQKRDRLGVTRRLHRK